MKRVTVEVPSSWFSDNPTKTWSFGCDGYVEYGIIECPDDLDTDNMQDWELTEMANNEQDGVRWLDEVPIAA